MKLIIGERPVALAHCIVDKEGSATIVTHCRELLASCSQLAPSGVTFLLQGPPESRGRPESPADVDGRPQRSIGYVAAGRRG